MFIATPNTWAEHGVGAPRLSYTFATLKALQRDLARIGIPLMIANASTYSNVAAVIEEIVRSQKIDEVHAGIEYGVDELDRDRAVARAIKPLNCTLVMSDTQTILPVYEIKNKSGFPYKVFTPFRRAWEEKFMNTERSHPPLSGKVTPLNIQSDDVSNGFEACESWSSEHTWEAGQAAGHSRLGEFIRSKEVLQYQLKRDRPDLEGTSALSPWLAVGSVSPGRCVDELGSGIGPRHHNLAGGCAVLAE